MAQSRRMSLAESITDTIGSVMLGVLINFYLLPIFFGMQVSLTGAMSYTAIFIVIGIFRKYLFRRLFEWLENIGIN